MRKRCQLKGAALFVAVVFACVLAGLPTADAQALGRPLTHLAEVVQAIDTATEELMVATDLLRSKEVANALRQAIVERSVKLYMVVPPESITDPASYVRQLGLFGRGSALGLL